MKNPFVALVVIVSFPFYVSSAWGDQLSPIHDYHWTFVEHKSLGQCESNDKEFSVILSLKPGTEALNSQDFCYAGGNSNFSSYYTETIAPENRVSGASIWFNTADGSSSSQIFVYLADYQRPEPNDKLSGPVEVGNLNNFIVQTGQNLKLPQFQALFKISVLNLVAKAFNSQFGVCTKQGNGEVYCSSRKVLDSEKCELTYAGTTIQTSDTSCWPPYLPQRRIDTINSEIQRRIQNLSQTK